MQIKSNNSQNSELSKESSCFQLFGCRISKRFIFIALAISLVAGVLYSTLIHTHVIQFWYAQQELPVFKLDSRYLSRYSGRAQLLLSDGSLLYEGELLGGQRHGTGTLCGTSGEIVYDGMFENNLYHGAGTLHYIENGTAYTFSGTFHNGVESGSGQLFRGDALIYDGEFAHGLYEGQGKLREDDKLYDGAFVAGLYEVWASCIKTAH